MDAQHTTVFLTTGNLKASTGTAPQRHSSHRRGLTTATPHLRRPSPLRSPSLRALTVAPSPSLPPKVAGPHRRNPPSIEAGKPTSSTTSVATLPLSRSKCSDL
ncbi:hypothetical protein L484_009927 [Morus notabilis]|uniref:Uncharacterized protein n=1 Tax=Morus notabilis TaxID=981085 RepID=W9STF9_9ROSA|nr:hypothetical protein L484_009927 [Morus notabilis]